MTEKRKRCEAAVYKRDTYRVSRGGNHHFKMHYSKEQCARPALAGATLCRQHSKKEERFGNIMRAVYWEHCE